MTTFYGITDPTDAFVISGSFVSPVPTMPTQTVHQGSQQNIQTERTAMEQEYNGSGRTFGARSNTNNYNVAASDGTYMQADGSWGAQGTAVSYFYQLLAANVSAVLNAIGAGHGFCPVGQRQADQTTHFTSVPLG